MRSNVHAVLLGLVLAPAADAGWIHQQSGHTARIDKEQEKTRAVALVILSNSGKRVVGGGDAWSMGSAIKLGAGLGNSDSTTSTWQPDDDDPVGEAEWSGQIDMALHAETRSGESAAMIMAEARCRILVDTAEVLDESLVLSLGIETEDDLLGTFSIAPGGIGLHVPISLSTGHGSVESTDNLLIPNGCKCGNSVQVIRHCYSYTVTYADGWYSFLLGTGRAADAATEVDAEVNDEVNYIYTCGK